MSKMSQLATEVQQQDAHLWMVEVGHKDGRDSLTFLYDNPEAAKAHCDHINQYGILSTMGYAAVFRPLKTVVRSRFPPRKEETSSA